MIYFKQKGLLAATHRFYEIHSCIAANDPHPHHSLPQDVRSQGGQPTEAMWQGHPRESFVLTPEISISTT